MNVGADKGTVLLSAYISSKRVAPSGSGHVAHATPDRRLCKHAGTILLNILFLLQAVVYMVEIKKFPSLLMTKLIIQYPFMLQQRKAMNYNIILISLHNTIKTAIVVAVIVNY